MPIFAYECVRQWVLMFTSCLPAERLVGDVTEPPAIECCACGTAKYRLTFHGNWSEKVHPKDYPSEFKSVAHGNFLASDLLLSPLVDTNVH